MDVGTLVAHLKVKGTEAVSKSLKDVEQHADKIGNRLAAVGKVSALAGAAGGAIALAAASRGASGAVLAIPAAAGLAASSLAALKVGTSGTGDALKALASGDAGKAAEALAKLSPSARSAVLAMDGVRKSYAGVKAATQDSLFRGLSTEITSLGGTYLPILQRGLTSNAAALNAWAMSGIAAAKSPFVTGAVNSIMGQSASIMMQSSGAAGSLVTIFAALAQAGMPLLQAGAGIVTRFLATKAAFLSSAEGAAWLSAKVNLARSILGALGAIVRNVATVIGSMFTAATSTGSQLLGTLVRLTGAAAAWASSAEGQQQMADTFRLLGGVLSNLLVILPPISGAFMTLMSFIASLPAPVQSIVTGFGSFALVAGLLLPKITGLVGTLTTFGSLLAGGASRAVMAAARIGLLGTAAQTGAAATNASALRIVGSWLMMAARSTASAVVTAAAWTLSTAGAAAAAVGRMVATAALMVAQWAMMAAGAMARAVVMAASWLVAMGPIGWVIAAVVGLVALIIANWDTVKNWTVSAWNAVVGAVVGAWNAVKAIVIGTLIYVVAYIMSCWARAKAVTVSAFTGLKNAVSTGINTVVGFVRSLPGRILSALASLGRLLVNLGRDMLTGLWNGISNGVSWLLGKVRGIGSQILSAAKGALGIGSPSKEMRDEVGRWIPAGMAVGIEANGRQATSALAGVSRSLTASLGDQAIRGARARQVAPAGARGDGGPLDLSDAAIAKLADALASRPVELDGKRVTRGVQRREAFDRRLTTTTRR